MSNNKLDVVKTLNDFSKNVTMVNSYIHNNKVTIDIYFLVTYTDRIDEYFKNCYDNCDEKYKYSILKIINDVDKNTNFLKNKNILEENGDGSYYIKSYFCEEYINSEKFNKINFKKHKTELLINYSKILNILYKAAILIFLIMLYFK